ncbi:MAG: dihydrolipoyl dehydrogenase [Actinomycetota bacterium]|nr:dihydrolipoyl dehydrogenase [Actinomycetota bacterium]
MAEGSDSFDLVILGGGNAGYACAFRAVALGMSVAMIERDKVGGTCLHRGCIPTKALLHSAELLDEIRHAGQFGIKTDEDPGYDWDQVKKFKDSVVGNMYKGLSGLVKRKKVELIDGYGRLKDNKTVVVEIDSGSDESSTERTVKATKAVVLATGSVARDLPFIKADGRRVHNSTHGLEADDVPNSVVVVGGNYIGLEFASVFRSFGAEVTVVEMLPRIAPAEDSDISEALLKLLQKRGIKFELGVTVTDAKTSDNGVQVTIEREAGSAGSRDDEAGSAGSKETKTVEADRMFVAIGRAPNTDDMGFEEAGIKLDRGFVVVDPMFSTGLEGVYAIGDAIHVPDVDWMHPQLAHVAFIEGIKLAEHLAGENPVPVDYKNIPHVIYCQPEVASVGLTEDKAKELGMEVNVARYPFAANARSLMLGGGQGFVKTVAEKDGAVVGVHAVGARVSDLITEAQLATSWEAFPDELAELMHPHPTLSEAIGETFMDLAGKPLHH